MKPSQKPRPARRGHAFRILMVFGVLFPLAAAVFLYRALTVPYGEPDRTRKYEVRKGANSAVILRGLREAGVLRDDFIPLIWLKTIRRGDLLKAGTYEFDRPLSAIAVIDKLVLGDVVFRTVTIREGLDRFAIADLMAREGFGSRRQWLAATGMTEMLEDLDPRAESLEGYLFPDTYRLAPGTTPQAIASMMVGNFRRQFAGELALNASGLDLHDTVTLASIVETEAQLDSERPAIASVYLNRIRKGMPLQADPTVIYSMKIAGRWTGNIRKDDLRTDSPYNTYTRRGFPPGPIANPGLASLRAAAAPATTSWLYFVSKNDGSHAFAATLAEHNRNVEIHQKRYWRDRRERATRNAGGN